MLLDNKDEQLRDKTIRGAQFREIARDIVATDRDMRKFGRNGDTGGAIKRALENAYKLGMQHTLNKPIASESSEDEEDDTVNWNVIPKKSRDAFYSIMQYKYLVFEIKSVPRLNIKEAWAMHSIIGGTGKFVRTISKSVMAPLINLGLLKVHLIQGRNALVYTVKGIGTWNVAINSGYIPDGKHYIAE